jgi:hypothetical protein
MRFVVRGDDDVGVTIRWQDGVRITWTVSARRVHGDRFARYRLDSKAVLDKMSSADGLTSFDVRSASLAVSTNAEQSSPAYPWSLCRVALGCFTERALPDLGYHEGGRRAHGL